MLPQKAYRIEESGTRGKIVVADLDIKAGELVLEEKEPLLFFTHSFYSQYDSYSTVLNMAIPAYSTFMNELTLIKQRQFLTLFGPTTDTNAEIIRNFTRENFQFRFPGEKEHRNLTADEIEVFVKVAQVVRLNLFGDQKLGYAIFEEATRFAHSCDSNCYYVFEGRSIACYAKHAIKADTELTFSYLPSRDIEPVYQRRHKYLEAKEFTCHCRRCDAPGDDTRQFDCFHLKCKGVMMVCQPLSKEPITVPGLTYTGVEYVEPHLLPCTVCHRAAPADYQQKMFELEAQLPALCNSFAARFKKIVANDEFLELDRLFMELNRVKFPRHHAAALTLLQKEWQMLHMMHCGGAQCILALQTILLDYFSTLEMLFPHPHPRRFEELKFAIMFTISKKFPAVFSPKQEKDICQKALRMGMILRGRHCRDDVLDEVTAWVLKKLPPFMSTEVCSFCEESPQLAALTLSRCGRCKQVTYCSAGCQKAHWSQHKKTCKG